MNSRTRASVPHAEYFPPRTSDGDSTGWLDVIAEDARQLALFAPVLRNMVVQELRVRYQRSILGFLWTLLNPILMLATMAVVLAQVMGVNAEGFAVYLFAGMLPWNFFAASVIDSSASIIANEGLIRKIYLPKLIFPLARVLINLTTFLLTMGALFFLLKPLGAKVTPSLLMLPVVVALFAAFTLGLGLIVATLNTFFRDAGHLIAVILQAWYFATPIIYETSRFRPEVMWRFWLNPVYPFIRMFHGILRDGLWPDRVTFMVAAGVATVSLGIGYAAFKSNEDTLVFRL